MRQLGTQLVQERHVSVKYVAAQICVMASPQMVELSEMLSKCLRLYNGACQVGGRSGVHSKISSLMMRNAAVE